MSEYQQIIKILPKEDDFEFYPSTKEMLRTVSADIKSNINPYGINNLNLLDIGCGNGGALCLLEECMDNKVNEYGEAENTNINFKKFGIEKSKTLIQNLREDVVIIGCDFEYNTLIDKKMDFIFCNPPYSEYSRWTVKILNEANCKAVYLIIPKRWREDKAIQSALTQGSNRVGESNITVLGSFDFLDSEFRKSRAKVDVLRIDFEYKESPFNIWFDEHFDIKTNDVDLEEEDSDSGKINIKDKLVPGQNLIERLVELYQEELGALLGNYKKLQGIDAALLEELGVDKGTIRKGLKQKIKGLKDKYWHELFDNLDKITERLTTKYRKMILDKMLMTVSVDVNVDNMYSIVIWIIKNSNIYQDKQLIDVYMRMTEPKNVEMYKSNRHFVADSWRYNFRKEITKYKLDYRLVFPCSINPGEWMYHNKNGLSQGGFDFISDIFTIAKTLGVELRKCGLATREWKMGRAEEFLDDKGEVFAMLRPYKNGNLHGKFSKDFILRLNVTAGRLNGWLRDPKHGVEEMGGEVEEIEKYFYSDRRIGYSIRGLLTEGMRDKINKKHLEKGKDV